VCTFYDLAPWRLSSRLLDEYVAGPGKRAHATVRKKITHIDGYFAFLEQRYRGDFTLRIPPSAKVMREFFRDWRAALPRARKYPVAVRDYVMAKIAYISGVRAAEPRPAEPGRPELILVEVLLGNPPERRTN
jgi:integrase